MFHEQQTLIGVALLLPPFITDEHGMRMVDGWEGTGHGRERGEVRGEGAVVTAAGGGADIEDTEGDGLQHWHLGG